MRTLYRYASTYAAATFGLDLRALAVWRMALASIILVDLVWRLGDLTVFYTDHGLWPRTYAMSYGGAYYWSIHLASGEAWFQLLLFGAAALFAGAMLVGYRTRLTAAASWFMLASLQGRNTLLSNGGDLMLLTMVFVSVFLPIGRRYSLDALKRGGPAGPGRVVSMACVLYLVQLSAVYMASGFLKSGDTWQEDYTAVWHVMNSGHFVLPLGRVLADYPALCKMLTSFMLYIERYGPLLILLSHPHLRLFLVVSYMGFHASTGFMMQLGIFPLIGAAAWIALIPSGVWDKAEAAVASLARRSALLAGLAGRLQRRGAGSQPPKPRLDARILRESLAAAFTALIVVANVEYLTKRAQPALLRPLIYNMGLRQAWSMFSPNAPRRTRWTSVEATLDSRRVVEAEGFGISENRPPRYAPEAFENARWSKFMLNMTDENLEGYRRTIALYAHQELLERGLHAEEVRFSLHARLINSDKGIAPQTRSYLLHEWAHEH